MTRREAAKRASEAAKRAAVARWESETGRASIIVWVTREERERIEAAARLDGRELSEWARATLLGVAEITVEDQRRDPSPVQPKPSAPDAPEPEDQRRDPNTVQPKPGPRGAPEPGDEGFMKSSY